MAAWATGAAAVAALAAAVGGPPLRRLARLLTSRSERAASPRSGRRGGTVSEAEERERALLDVLASDDPGRLVVFSLRRARGYADQARRRLAVGPDPTRLAARRRRLGRLTQLDRELDDFRVSGVPVDDLVAVRRLERRAAALAGTERPASGSPSRRRTGGRGTRSRGEGRGG